MLTRNVRLFLSLTAAIPLLFAACVDNGIFGPLADAAGTYQLTVFAGKSMPNATITYPPGDPDFTDPRGGTLVATDGTLVLNRDGTYTETNYELINVNNGSSTPYTFLSTGTWTVNGTVLRLSDPSGRQVTGELALNFDNNYTVSYMEGGTGSVQPYEYIRFVN